MRFLPTYVNNTEKSDVRNCLPAGRARAHAYHLLPAHNQHVHKGAASARKPPIQARAAAAAGLPVGRAAKCKCERGRKKASERWVKISALYTARRHLPLLYFTPGRLIFIVAKARPSLRRGRGDK